MGELNFSLYGQSPSHNVQMREEVVCRHLQNLLRYVNLVGLFGDRRCSQGVLLD